MTVKYKASFKKDTREYDGLDHEPTRKAIITNPLQRIYAVVALDVARIENLVDTGGQVVPQMKIVHIEPQNGDDLIVVREMLDKSFRERTGQGAQVSLFDQEDPQAVMDAERVGDILNGALPQALTETVGGDDGDPTNDEAPADGKPDDEPPAAPTSRGRGRK